ncbi:MAG: hypothetical protein Q8P22_10295 [Chloroflexota bacterium]|nr:hypothetical protein [Chloroflexota bacterium]
MKTRQRVDYHEYLASREWRLKRTKVIDFAQGICERCGSAPIRDVHHNNYRNIGNEDPLVDLIGVCRPCHEYLAGVREEDRALVVVRGLLAEHGLLPVYYEDHPDWSPKYFYGGESRLGCSLTIDIAPAHEPPGPGFNPSRLHIPIAVGVVGYCYWWPEEEMDE